MEKEALNLAQEKLARQEEAVLCLLFETDGSTPRRGGALLCVAKSRGIRSVATGGTVGGGEMELACIKHASAMIESGTSDPEAIEFDLSGNRGALNMTCGGRAKVLFVPFGPSGYPFTGAAATLAKAGSDRHPSYLNVRIVEGRVKFFEVSSEAKYFVHQHAQTSEGGNVLVAAFTLEVCAPTRLFIIGAGHVARALCPVASKVGFSVTIYDARAELATCERFPEAESVVMGKIDEINTKLNISRGDYVCIMTPGHEGDLEATYQVLKTDASYIGLIGSHRKIALSKDKLAAGGFKEEEIKRLNAPVGLEIGAETPEEIAVSITAQLIAAKAKVSEVTTGRPGHNLSEAIKNGISII